MNAELEREVRSRAAERCEYCLIPQSADIIPHQIDHIIALKHQGQTSSENLALACLNCNIHKGPNIAGLDPETGALVRLFHPRQDRWQDHFQLAGNGHVIAKTPVGRVTEYVLNMNEPVSVVLRAMLILEGILAVA